MKYRFFTVPVHYASDVTEELNQFLASHRIVQVDKQWVADGPNSQWAFAISFDETPSSKPMGKNKAKEAVDYRQVLSEEDFTRYARLRDLRKQLAEAEGVPAYTIFTNVQLAAMVTQRVSQASDMINIEGVGQAKRDKYGAAFLPILLEMFSAASAS